MALLSAEALFNDIWSRKLTQMHNCLQFIKHDYLNVHVLDVEIYFAALA